jgi:hypothetical protein
MGSMNIMDAPQNACYIAQLGYKLAGEEPPAKVADLINGKAPRFHFELPGSTHGFRVLSESGKEIGHRIYNSDERSASGRRSLKLAVPFHDLINDQTNGIRLFYKTCYESGDFCDSRYDPCFSPIFYPGQTISCKVCYDTQNTRAIKASIYAYDRNAGKLIEGPSTDIGEQFTALEFTVPFMKGACISEVGVIFRAAYDGVWGSLCAWLDDFDISGVPDYTIDFSKERMDIWNNIHCEVSQFSRLKGIWNLEGNVLSGSCADFAEAYTGDVNFKNYSFSASVRPLLGSWHGINFRVQGAVRSYAAVLSDGNILRLMKNENGYRTLCETDYIWEPGGCYRLTVEAEGDTFTVSDNGRELLRYTDTDKPYLHGAIGASIRDGSRCHYADFAIKGRC